MSKKTNDLFDNPMIREARKNMSKDQIEQLKKKGEQLSDVDFTKLGTVDQDQVNEVATQLDLMLQSGIHPSYLTRSEKEFLNEYVGSKWYEKYGYLENDLNRINFGK